MTVGMQRGLSFFERLAQMKHGSLRSLDLSMKGGLERVGATGCPLYAGLARLYCFWQMVVRLRKTASLPASPRLAGDVVSLRQTPAVERDSHSIHCNDPGLFPQASAEVAEDQAVDENQAD